MASIITETVVRAAGLLIYRKNVVKNPPKIEYLLLQHSYEPYHWTPPKGHVDPGEDEWTAAIREVQEETGIDAMCKLEVHKEDFEHEMSYTVDCARENKREKAHKKVTYWLAKALDHGLEVKLSKEHTDWKWVELQEAKKLAKFEEMGKMLDAAELAINKAD